MADQIHDPGQQSQSNLTCSETAGHRTKGSGANLSRQGAKISTAWHAPLLTMIEKAPGSLKDHIGQNGQQMVLCT